jgi:hypothetical protein
MAREGPSPVEALNLKNTSPVVPEFSDIDFWDSCRASPLVGVPDPRQR